MSDRELLEQILAGQQAIRAMLEDNAIAARRRAKVAARQAKRRAKKAGNPNPAERDNHAGGEGGALSFSSIDLAKNNDLKIVHTSRSVTVTQRDNHADDAKVFAFWREHLCKRHDVKFAGTKRQRNVKARLAQGYSVERLCDAIRGCKLSPYNMGKNDTGAIYDDLELICRDAEHVDRFISFAGKGAAQLSALPVSAERKAEIDRELEELRRGAQ